MTESLTLNQLKIGESMVVSRVCADAPMRRRLEDIGVVAGTRISCLMLSPLGDPRAYLIRGAVIALRSIDAEKVIGLPFLCEERGHVWD